MKCGATNTEGIFVYKIGTEVMLSNNEEMFEQKVVSLLEQSNVKLCFYHFIIFHFTDSTVTEYEAAHEVELKCTSKNSWTILNNGILR